MKRRILSALLAAALIIGAVPLISLAEPGDAVTAPRGEYVYSLSADPDTGIVPDGFGTIPNNGRIWTDKSVSINDDRFDVNLKVLAQEYISSFGTTETQSIAADVLFILDFTTSMYNNRDVEKDDGTSVTRLSAMVDAANEAIEIITQTNPNNRIKIFRFSGNSTSCAQYSHEIMPLAHYTSSSTSTDTKDKYIRLSGTRSVASSSTLLKDGESFTFTEQAQSGTCTQYGIAAGVKSFVEDINAETDNSIERRPYVIMLTDGEPTLASKNWNSETLSDLRTNTITTSSGGDKYELMATGAILSASIWRDRLTEAYEEYNSNGKDIDVQWFNIGLGVDEPADPDDPSYTACLLNPYYMVGVEGRNGTGATSVEKIKYYLGYSDWAPKVTEKDYSADGNYTYINEGDGYVTFANTYSVLMNAFVTLANIIKMGSQEYTIPIVNHEGSGEASSDVVFTDVIGEGMFITDITLKPNGASPVTGVDPDGDGTYTFHGYSTTVTVTEDAGGQQTLVWNLPATEVAMFTFADRENITNGEYIPAEPTTLTYGVNFDNDIGEGPAYTNAFDGDNTPLTTVAYEIPGDNDYYFNVITDDEFNFVSSTMKTDNDATAAKTDNVTGSAAYSSSYAYTAVADGTADSSATVSGLLGNNGKVTFLSRKEIVDITVEKKWEDATGNPIENTSSLPDVEITLFRKAENSDTEETVSYITLSDSDGYSETLTLPIRNANDERYTYYIREDCPDGYFTVDYSPELTAKDGKLTVTNREFPEEGLVAVRKLWKNRIGATLTDTGLPEVEMQLNRHVEKHTPTYFTVTISVQGEADVVKSVVPGSTVSFYVTFYCSKKNQSNGKISLNGTQLATTQMTNSVSYRGNTLWPAVTTNVQSFTINEDTQLNYTYSKTLTTYRHPGFITDGTIHNTDQDNRFVSIEETTQTPPVTSYYDEEYDTFTLNSSNGWQKVYDDLVLSETGDDASTYSYKYYVEEISEVPGFVTSYSSNNTAGIEGGVLTVTNTSTSNIPVLPETGGRLSPVIITATAGSMLMLAAAAFVLLDVSPGRRRRHRKRIN